MTGSKIVFSAREKELMLNAEIILTKNVVLQKIRELLEEVQQRQVNLAEVISGRESLLAVSAKISRGENYLGLPYLILDFPRIFRGDDIFAIRSMFWWGRFFSSTLHLSGRSCLRFREAVGMGWKEFTEGDYYLGIREDPWQHHFEKDNYRRIREMEEAEFRDTVNRRHQIKIAAKWPLDEPLAARELYESWKLYVKICGLVS